MTSGLSSPCAPEPLRRHASHGGDLGDDVLAGASPERRALGDPQGLLEEPGSYRAGLYGAQLDGFVTDVAFVDGGIDPKVIPDAFPEPNGF